MPVVLGKTHVSKASTTTSATGPRRTSSRIAATPVGRSQHGGVPGMRTAPGANTLTQAGT